jgi:hypothetical protein
MLAEYWLLRSALGRDLPAVVLSRSSCHANPMAILRFTGGRLNASGVELEKPSTFASMYTCIYREKYLLPCRARALIAQVPKQSSKRHSRYVLVPQCR